MHNTATMSPGFYEVEPKQLARARYNPKSRTEKKNIRDLVKSIGAHGQFVPILVDPQLNIIDGHRRHAAINELGMDTCQVRVVGGNPAEVYAEVNSAAKPLSGNDHISVYCQSPDAVTGVTLTRLKQMHSEAGDELMQYVADHGSSVAIFQLAKKLAKHCGAPKDTELIANLTKWLIQTKSSYSARKAMEDDVAPSVIFACLKSGKSLRRSWSA